MSPVVGYPSPPSCPSSPPSTSGEEVATERKKPPAKYECQYCQKRFNRPSSLKLHYNTHTGEKPFACPFPGCGRHFSVMSNMRRHARIHGDPSKKTPHESSVDDSFEATAYSSSSSTHNTPTTSQVALMPSSKPYPHSHSSSAASSSHVQSFSVSSLESRRHQTLAGPHHYPHRRSRSPLSDQGGSSPER
ncbi:hypothetical protein JB92DRAFT_2757335 [Gautieria morchelliformis]|nr:hypothetical protein JB92DRAFT_2757335 [Gautieria morchelliformis]